MRYNEKGEELPDGTPVEVPVNLKRPPPLHEMIKAFVRRELSAQADANGQETFEEANDFGEEDEEELPMTPYEGRVVVDEDVVSHVETERLDRKRKKGYRGGTVEMRPEQPKESGDVSEKRTGGHSSGAGDVSQAAGAAGGSSAAGRGSESVSGGGGQGQ